MEEYTQITLDEWMQWKEDIRQKLAETAGNFVYIGYRLKQIRDSGMYDGAANIFEFAQREYGLGKSTVSRFIAINEKYSEGGNSLELKAEYRNFSSSKLAEMLTLPDSELELITEQTTIKEIRELKEFNSQEIPEDDTIPGQCEIADYIPTPEEAVPPQKRPESLTPLDKCLADFFQGRKDVLCGLMKCLEADPPDYRTAADLMNPSGQSSHKKGLVFLFLYDWSTGVKYKVLTQPDPVSLTWPELLDDIFQLYGAGREADAWEAFYGEKDQTTDNNSVATSQQQEEVKTEEREDVREAAEPAGADGAADEQETEDSTTDAGAAGEDAGDRPGPDERVAAEEAGNVEVPETEKQTTHVNSVATSQQKEGRCISGTLTCTIRFEGLYVAPGQTETDALFGSASATVFDISNETWVFDDDN